MRLLHSSAPARTGVVIPCFNEAQRLKAAEFDAFLESSEGVSLLFVDDGSRDGTTGRLAEIAARWPERVTAWRLAENRGKAEAVRLGLLQARELGFAQIGFWDADLATPLSTIPDFVRVLDSRSDVHIVWGTRLPLMGHRIVRETKRRWIGRSFSFAAALAVGVPVRDMLCGAKLFRCVPLLDWLLHQPFQSRWVFDVELLARMHYAMKKYGRARLRDVLYEFPLDDWEEIGGSRIRSGDYLRATLELGGLAYRSRFASMPAFPDREPQIDSPLEAVAARPPALEHVA